MLPCHLSLISSWELVLFSQEYPTNFLTSFHQRTAPAHRTPLSGNSILGCHPRSYNTWAQRIKTTIKCLRLQTLMTEGCIKLFHCGGGCLNTQQYLKLSILTTSLVPLKMTPGSGSGFLFSIVDGSKFIKVFFSMFIWTPSPRWIPSSSHESFFCKTWSCRETHLSSPELCVHKSCGWVQHFTNCCFFMF